MSHCLKWNSLWVALGFGLASGLFSAADNCAEDWPQHLGPRRNGCSPETDLRLDWSRLRPVVRWKAPLGRGAAGPVVVGEHVFNVADRGSRVVATCHLAIDGSEQWVRELGSSQKEADGTALGPSATPLCADGKLYVALGSGEVSCLSADDGQTIWQWSPKASYGGLRLVRHAPAKQQLAAPLLVEGFLIVQPGGTAENAVVALDSATGKQVWSAGSDGIGAGAPRMVQGAGHRQLVASSGANLLGIDPLSGTVLWRFPFGDPRDLHTASLVWNGERLIQSSASGSGTTAFELQAVANRVMPVLAWRSRALIAHCGTPILHADYLYGLHGTVGEVSLRCLNVANGHLEWSHTGPGRCQLMCVDSHLISLTETGHLVVIPASPQGYREVGRLSNLLTAPALAPPALSNGLLYARDQQRLVCVDLRNDQRE